jgi:hypothetical protein
LRIEVLSAIVSRINCALVDVPCLNVSNERSQTHDSTALVRPARNCNYLYNMREKETMKVEVSFQDPNRRPLLLRMERSRSAGGVSDK